MKYTTPVAKPVAFEAVSVILASVETTHRCPNNVDYCGEESDL